MLIVGDCIDHHQAAAHGYGSVWRDGKTVGAHRAAVEQVAGPIPNGLLVHHICGNRRCRNFFHLDVATRRSHRRMDAALQTHCKRGHEFTPDNTYIAKGGGRHCRKCHCIRERARRGR